MVKYSVLLNIFLLIAIFTSLILDTLNDLTEAVVQRCSVKKVFLEISHNSQENTRAGVSFKKETLAQVFPCEFCEISNNAFLNRTPLVAASYLTFFNNLRFASPNDLKY